MFVPSAVRPGWRELETPAVRFGPRAHFNIELQDQAFGRIVKRQDCVPSVRSNPISYENWPFEYLRHYSRQPEKGLRCHGLASSRTNRVHDVGQSDADVVPALQSGLNWSLATSDGDCRQWVSWRNPSTILALAKRPRRTADRVYSTRLPLSQDQLRRVLRS
jgi:hypothetical protein